jgi:hypothetical protein
VACGDATVSGEGCRFSCVGGVWRCTAAVEMPAPAQLNGMIRLFIARDQRQPRLLTQLLQHTRQVRQRRRHVRMVRVVAVQSRCHHAKQQCFAEEMATGPLAGERACFRCVFRPDRVLRAARVLCSTVAAGCGRAALGSSLVVSAVPIPPCGLSPPHLAGMHRRTRANVWYSNMYTAPTHARGTWASVDP